MRYFKLVKLMDDVMVSLGFGATIIFPGVRYVIGERTRPVGGAGGLLAFRTLEQTQEFAEANNWNLDSDDGAPPDAAILIGRGKQRRLSRWRATRWFSIDEAWSGRICRDDREEWPPGTVALAWFEPEKVVTDE